MKELGTTRAKDLHGASHRVTHGPAVLQMLSYPPQRLRGTATNPERTHQADQSQARDRWPSSRPVATRLSIGRYYLVDVDRNVIFGHDVDPAQLGREIGCLAPTGSAPNEDSIDDNKVRAAIAEVMEGGREAFKLRANKYGV